jgi:hypothetical protein
VAASFGDLGRIWLEVTKVLRVGFVNSVVADFQGNPEPAAFGR